MDHTASPWFLTTLPWWRGAARSTVFDAEIVENLPGYFCYRIIGAKAETVFSGEAGGHRIQQVPASERKGRVHTSTITVAVLPEPSERDVRIHDGDLVIRKCRGSGAGGQNRNVTDSAVVITHTPTGVVVRCESERSQTQNLHTAMSVLRARLQERERSQAASTRAGDRKAQVGSGQRADKIRTVRYQDDQVNDHVTGRFWRLRDYLKGQW